MCHTWRISRILVSFKPPSLEGSLKLVSPFPLDLSDRNYSVLVFRTFISEWNIWITRGKEVRAGGKRRLWDKDRDRSENEDAVRGTG